MINCDLIVDFDGARCRGAKIGIFDLGAKRRAANRRDPHPYDLFF